MTTTVPRSAGYGWPHGVSARPLSLVRTAAFAGLMLAGTVLLILVLAPVVLTALGLGHLLQDLMRSSRSGVSRNDVIAAVTGLAGLRFLAPAALLGTRRLAALTRRLSARWCGVIIHEAYRPAPAGTRSSRLDGTIRLGYLGRMRWLLNDPATWRDLRWIPVNAVVGTVLVGLPLVLLAAGGGCFSIDFSTGHATGNARITLLVLGALLPVLGLAVAPLTLSSYGGLARALLAPSGQAELELRVRHLAQTRKESLDTGAAELRRIERDLHDGAQARLVAMGLTLDAAGRLIDPDPAAARALLIEARDASAKALGELRDLVRGIHPPVLADRGLAAAVRALALDAPVRVLVTGELDGRVAAPVESAAYFAVSELLANVAKHAGVAAAEVDLRHEAGALRISVRDEGGGGADPARGTGLSGIGRRLAAFDGVVAVASPVGGPTVITLDVPCALS
ncbi:MAG: histidine kinase [Trebonia sp.]